MLVPTQILPSRCGCDVHLLAAGCASDDQDLCRERAQPGLLWPVQADHEACPGAHEPPGVPGILSSAHRPQGPPTLLLILACHNMNSCNLHHMVA